MSAPHWRGARSGRSRHHGQAGTRTPATAGRADAPPAWTPSARDAFEALLRDGLGPRLRALGFRGSGTAFRWPREGWLVQLGVQRSRDSTRQRVLFTINLSAVQVMRWEQARAADPRLPKVPSANVCYGSDLMWWSRIRSLYPEPPDDWWELRADDDWSALADQIAADVEAFVVPVLRRGDDDTVTGRAPAPRLELS